MDENIINKILEIDKNAKDKITEAGNRGDKIIAEAEAEKKRIVDNGIKEAEKKIARIEADEKRKADEKLAGMRELRDADISRLERVFEDRHAEWEENIFKAVIGG